MRLFTTIAISALIGLASAQPKLERLSSLGFGIADKEGAVAEIPTYDAKSKKLFVASAKIGGVVVIDFQNPALPVFLDTVQFSGAVGETLNPNCVSAYDGKIAVAVEKVDSIDASGTKYARHQKGMVAIIDAMDANHGILKTFEAGYLPDMVTFSKNGKIIAVANEGEPSKNYVTDPDGSVTLIDLSSGLNSAVVKNVQFSQLNNATDSAKLVAKGVVLDGFKNATVAQDLEPEYITLNDDASKAWVSLQENNSIAIIDVASATLDSIVALPKKDLSRADNGFGSSNAMDLQKDSKVGIKNWNVNALLMPDGIHHFSANGKSYILTANEGDGRDYGTGFINEIKVSKVGTSNWTADVASTDITALPDLTLHMGQSKNSAGKYDKMVIYGGRSFSVLDANAQLIWDSGDQFEQTTARLFPTTFNINHEPNKIALDDRSAKKGPEPESVVSGLIDGKTYAFVGLERQGGIMIYDVSTPTAPIFVDYTNKRDMTGTTLATTDVLGPEGLNFIPAAQSPNGKNLLIVANEVSGTIETYTFENSSIVANAWTVLPQFRINDNELVIQKEGEISIYNSIGQVEFQSKVHVGQKIPTAFLGTGRHLIRHGQNQMQIFIQR